MSKSQADPNYLVWRAQRARTLRSRLELQLGLTCKFCGAVRNLEFDCIISQGDDHHRMNPYDRIRFYMAQVMIGNVQLLCEKCHRKKTAAEAAQAELIFANVEQPF